MFKDFREFIKTVQEKDHAKIIEGANWDLEIGLITELSLQKPNNPLLLFDKIEGYQSGYRVASNIVTTPGRCALALGLPPEVKGIESVKMWRNKIKQEFKPLAPVEVSTGPIKEHVHTGSDLDIFEFPIPKWHPLDGGRYIGTGHMVIQRDPDTGWINVGTYRVQAMDRAMVTLSVNPTQHGFEIARKYWDKGTSCPVAIVCGQDPFLWLMACSNIPRGISEFDYAGWINNEPVKVVKGLTVDLPIPAGAEIVLEGEYLSPETETKPEGPFGEWWGYYGGGVRPKPIVRLKAVCHRKDPIITGAPPLLPIDHDYARGLIDAAELWNELDRTFPGIRGVWLVPEARGGPMCVISMEQYYAGHARHVAAAAVSSRQCHKFIIIVDEDIDPSNIAEVLWALGTRCEPENSIDVLSGFKTQPSNPMLEPQKRNRGDISSSRALIYACKPYSWRKEFPLSLKSSPKLLKGIEEKWGKELFDS